MAVGGSLTFPIDLAQNGPQIAFQFFQYSKPSPFAPTKLNLTNDIVYLPIPANLAENYTIQYETYEPGMFALLFSGNAAAWKMVMADSALGGLADLAFMGGPEIAAAMAPLVAAGILDDPNFVGPGGGGVAQMLYNFAANGSLPGKNALGPSARYLIDKLGSTINESLGASLQNYFGTAPNPNTTVAFKAPQLRTHNFSWVFAPKNPTESDLVAEIIQQFKINFLPQVDASRFFLTYPNIVYPQFIGTGNYLYTFKPCVITDFAAHYAPSGPSFFSSGGVLPGSAAGFPGQDGYPPTLIAMGFSLTEIMLFTEADATLSQAQLFAQDTGGAGGITQTPANPPAAAAAAPNPNAPDDLNVLGG